MGAVWYNTTMKNEFNYKIECVYVCRYLIVWCTKYRRKVLINDIEERLKELIQDICQEAITVIEIKVTPNSVQLQIETDPRQSIHSIIKKLKAKTSGALRSEFKELTTKIPTLWTNSYFLTTVGDASEFEPMIEAYVLSQKTSQRM